MKLKRQWIDPDTGLEVDGWVNFSVADAGWVLISLLLIFALILFLVL